MGLWCVLLAYDAALALTLIYFLFLAPLAYIYMLLLPIPVLAPLYLFRRLYPPPDSRERWWLYIRLIGITVLLLLRAGIDLWLPIRI
ncbi:MAG: hypothetical protein KDK30_13215 [Leptospiraceae bacterium]|nr:hypothetical protein [Leptospiraceae bacterium]